MSNNIRWDNPILNVKQVKDKGRPSTSKHERLVRKELNIQRVNSGISHWTPYSELTDDERKTFIRDSMRNRAKYYKERSRVRNMVKKKVKINRLKREGHFRVCIYCKELLSLGAFDNRNDKSLNIRTKTQHVHRRSYCYECRIKKNHEYYLNNKEKWVKHDT